MRQVGDTLSGGVAVLIQDTCWVRLSTGKVLEKVTDAMPHEPFDAGLLLYRKPSYNLQKGPSAGICSRM